MTSTQLIVVALIAASFVAGWILRGQVKDEDDAESREAHRVDDPPAASVPEGKPSDGTDDLLGSAEAALERAWAAYLRARAGAPEDVLALRQAITDARQLGDLSATTRNATDPPLLETYDRAVDALESLCALARAGQVVGPRVHQCLSMLADARRRMRSADGRRLS